MSQPTRNEVLQKLRRRYERAGLEHKGKLLDQAQELLGYHRKSAIRALRARAVVRSPRIMTGRPRDYEPGLLLPFLRPIWQATDYACGRRLVAMLPEWVPAYEQHERSLPEEVREKLLSASGRTLDRLLEPLRWQEGRRCLTRPGTLLRHQIPIRGSVWDDENPGWLEVDTVALCGGSVAGEFVWMVDGVDYATAWVEVRAMWGRGQAGTLAALQDVEASLPFALLGLDSDNGGEFLNYHVMGSATETEAAGLMTRSRPYIVVLRVTTNREGAEIRVHGKAVGKAPLSAPLFLDPGHHEISPILATAASRARLPPRPAKNPRSAFPSLLKPLATARLGRALHPWQLHFNPRQTQARPIHAATQFGSRNHRGRDFFRGCGNRHRVSNGFGYPIQQRGRLAHSTRSLGMPGLSGRNR